MPNENECQNLDALYPPGSTLALMTGSPAPRHSLISSSRRRLALWSAAAFLGQQEPEPTPVTPQRDTEREHSIPAVIPLVTVRSHSVVPSPMRLPSSMSAAATSCSSIAPAATKRPILKELTLSW